MGMRQAVVTGVVAEVLNRSSICDGWESKAPLHDPILGDIGGCGDRFGRSVLGEKIKGSDKFLGVGIWETRIGREAEVIGSEGRRGDRGEKEER